LCIVNYLKQTNIMKNLVFIIGKYKGAALAQIWDCDKSYVEWFLSNIDMPKIELQKALNEINKLRK